MPPSRHRCATDGQFRSAAVTSFTLAKLTALLSTAAVTLSPPGPPLVIALFTFLLYLLFLFNFTIIIFIFFYFWATRRTFSRARIIYKTRFISTVQILLFRRVRVRLHPQRIFMLYIYIYS